MNSQFAQSESNGGALGFIHNTLLPRYNEMNLGNTIEFINIECLELASLYYTFSYGVIVFLQASVTT